MVTLRRDVAVTGKNSIFDREDRDREALTEYDLFMMKKRKAETVSYGASAAVLSSQSRLAETNYFSYPNTPIEEPKPAITFADYGEYMTAQLHRVGGGRILTEEEFYAEKYKSTSAETESAPRATKSKKGAVRKQLSKTAKIFVAVYVLAVAAVASIILAVNTSGAPKVDAKAVANGESEEIGALALDNGDYENNWFDRVLDDMSNK